MSAILMLLIDFVINHEEKEELMSQNGVPLPIKDALNSKIVYDVVKELFARYGV